MLKIVPSTTPVLPDLLAALVVVHLHGLNYLTQGSSVSRVNLVQNNKIHKINQWGTWRGVESELKLRLNKKPYWGDCKYALHVPTSEEIHEVAET